METSVKIDAAAFKRTSDVCLRRALSKFGAYTRRRARSSIRKRKKISAPGAPPSGHTGALKNGILFAVESDRLEVVIGPALARSNAAKILEHGGLGPNGETYRARPFMGPAFQKELDASLVKIFTNCIRKTK